LLCGSCVYFRNPLELGGIYCFVNALKSVASWFVAAALYSQYFVAGIVSGMNTFNANYSGFLNSTGANATGANATGGISAFCPGLRPFKASRATDASATATGAIMHASKIGDVPLFATVGALAAVWLVAVAGLSFTIKREYLHTFVSLQTGYADTQSIFLEHRGNLNDAKRVNIFFFNERHWQAIRDRVRQWVLSVYATWQALMPAFFTADLQARIPDDFMPAQVVRDLNAQSPDGRRPTLQNMGLVRRMSHAAPVDSASHTDRGARRPSELPSPPSGTDGGGALTTSSASMFPGSDPTEPSASAGIMRPSAAASVAGPCNIEVGPAVSLAEIASKSYRDDPLVKPHDWPGVPDEDECLKLPNEVPEEVLQ
jgi:hypothetical protein